MNLNYLFLIAPIGSIIALVTAWIFYKLMLKNDPGNDQMQKIALAVREGAFAYLKQQYKVVALFFLIIFVLFLVMSFGLNVQNKWVPFSFLTGGFFSALAGYFGMSTATLASNRTAQGARKSLNAGLQIAFRSGAVMGLVVVGLGLLDISMWFAILYWLVPSLGFDQMSLAAITTTMLTFGMGASLQALFARVGGGIFTKAADVGADLVGKVEAGIPEDDPRNPATIADNVGDNVGDVAGMGADLYESYCGSILATAALGVAAFQGQPHQKILAALLAPMIVAGVGNIFSVIGAFAVRTEEKADQRTLLKALSRGVNLSVVLIAIFTAILMYFLKLPMGIVASVITGLLVGWTIGKITEYYTSQSYKPTRWIAEQSKTGPATVIIAGLSTGMLSTGLPVLTAGIGIILSYAFAGGFGADPNHINLGLYGISFAAVGMLSTLGITLATDAYGPIADNAGGNAEMSGLPKEVRQRTDALDSLGNTTAATGKGFAIGSAALTAMALIAAYIEEIKAQFSHIINNPAILQNLLSEVNIQFDPGASLKTLQELVANNLHLPQWIEYYNVTLMNPRVLVGMFLGSMVTFVFAALAMKAVGRAAGNMVEEVRRQFREKPGIMEGKDEPDYASCVAISTKGAQREMILPSLLVITVPVLTGLILGVAGVLGVLAGGLTTGFVLAVMLNNSGGAWDNAKKYIEEGNLGGKGSDAHKAAVVGDTVGDPCKDTAGPCLNIVIKLMSTVSIVTVGLAVKFGPVIGTWLGIGPR
ncbi:MAG: sodium-translocating pyrophosphatase [Candidatus Marinimicrobia bacterium]|nr:sodium-translocating pyrophosphatase [Candidatus Neomarinimicrobiota bacterium]MBP9005872.1 sodium-translocating pyrophosphatase [Candidatus Neomarinimicrobiota bacterium]OQC47292.1 MAG: putative K(+)-stimulated pyrophosphate-energized sodium pump [Candidatus Marinimicrobia bacterium ADurb.Bin030]HPI28470.1 sodium-translocating pyrophosphatase [Candidatus Neomarinimicrobiota bacterium]HQM36508.1 sodium-translocating pyrophosphatase [Candidatus Neomarinimicrobiota bacterium]